MLDVILLNAGAMIYLAGRSRTMADGIKLAYSNIENGKALEVLKGLKNEKFIKSV